MEKDDVIKLAKDLGIDVEENSKEPGMYVNGEKLTESDLLTLFGYEHTSKQNGEQH